MPRRGESIFKRKDGRWEARYIHHYENGKARYRYLYAHSYAEVRAKRLEEQSQPEQSPLPKVKSIASFHTLSVLWLADVKASVKESTYTRYYRTVYHHLLPAFAEQMLVRLDEERIRLFAKRLLCGEDGRAPLSPKTVSDLLCVLKSIFRYGRRNGYPCADLSALKLPPVPQKSVKILPEGSRKSVERRLLSAAAGDADQRVRLGILLALYTGVRIGELCGLRYSDIDIENRCVTISRTVERIADLSIGATARTKVVIGEPKTQASARVIPLPSFLVGILEENATDPNCYLLTGTEKYTEPHQFYMRYKTFMRRLGLEQYTFHALRHTFATRCIDNGFDAKALSEILGHSNVSTTLSLYVHPTLEQKRRQMERLSPSMYL